MTAQFAEATKALGDAWWWGVGVDNRTDLHYFVHAGPDGCVVKHTSDGATEFQPFDLSSPDAMHICPICQGDGTLTPPSFEWCGDDEVDDF